jgi:hypothetical protein
MLTTTTTTTITATAAAAIAVTIAIRALNTTVVAIPGLRQRMFTGLHAGRKTTPTPTISVAALRSLVAATAATARGDVVNAVEGGVDGAVRWTVDAVKGIHKIAFVRCEEEDTAAALPRPSRPPEAMHVPVV